MRQRRLIELTTILLAAAGVIGGCVISAPVTPPALPAPTIASPTTIGRQAPEAGSPLPFKGKLTDGDADELPPAVAAALSPDAVVNFSYHEQLTHDEYHIPLLLSALDPVTYAGAPLGDYGVTAFASLTITKGETVLGNYTAKARVSKSYSIYSEPTHQEVEAAARAAVRDKIDARLYRDAGRVAGLIDAPTRRVAGAGDR
jgi:hypothetical protein